MLRLEWAAHPRDLPQTHAHHSWAYTDYGMISERAAEKLGFNTVQRLLSEFLVSTMGREELQRLHPVNDPQIRKTSLQYTDALQAILLQGDTLPLQDFIDVRGHLEQALPDHAMLSTAALDEVRKLCRASRRVQIFFSKKDSTILSGIVRPITQLKDLEEQIEDTLAPNGRIYDSASNELSHIRRKLRRHQVELREKLSALLRKAIREKYAAEPQLTMRAGRMVIPIRSEAKRKMRGFIHDSSATGQTVYLEPASCLDLGNEIRILETQEQREIERILRVLTAQVRKHAEAINTNLIILGKIDILHAKAQLSVKIEGVVPKLSTEPVLDIREGRNPALMLSGQSREIIPLTLTLGRGVRTLVITGPNAGGKTVAMKTCGLMLVMLGCGIPVPVNVKSTFGSFRQILVEIGDQQSIEQDISTFSARIAGLKEMCKTAANGVLLLIDEIGTGTDPAEGAALAQAVLEHFTASGALTVVTTHHGTLKAYAHDSDGIINGSMDFHEQTLQPTFMFRQGLPGSSYAFQIASRMKLDPMVLDRARQILGTPGITLESLILSYREKIKKLEQLPQRQLGKEKSIPHRKKPGKAAPQPAVQLHEGEQVVIDGGGVPCEIISIQGRHAMLSAGNIHMKVARSRLTPVQKKKLHHKGNVYRSVPRTSVDLRGLRVHEALAEVGKLLNQSAGTSLTTVEIIHGTGTGALRNSIHQYLRSPEVNKTFTCMDANPGVTIIDI